MSATPWKPTEPIEYGAGSGVRNIDVAPTAPLRNERQLRTRPTTGPRTCELTSATPLLKLSFSEQSATLLLACPNSDDAATRYISALALAGARVLESEQSTDTESSYLFQRVHADTSKVPGGSTTVERLLANLARQRGLHVEVQTSAKKRVAIFASKHDHCLYDLLRRQQSGELGCEISVVISNHPDLERVVGQFGVDYQVIAKTGENKLEAEARECELLEDRNIDLLVMARYMQVLTEGFIAHWQGRVINIHHSFLPAFLGAKPYHQAQQRGVKLIGATAHYVAALPDEGPIIEQDVVRCTHKDTTEDLITKGRDLERQVLARAVRWHIDDRVIVHGNKTVVFD